MAIPPAGPAAGMPLDPTTGADAGASPPASSNRVAVTISETSDGSYVVYDGDEPDNASATGDVSADDVGAMGAAGDVPAAGDLSGASGGTPAASVGAALKIAMDILNASKASKGGAGSADDQLMAGYGADPTPTPLRRPREKY